MSLALRATIGIVLADRTGEWCTPAWIASRVAAPVGEVVFECEELVIAGELKFDMKAGEPLFGHQVLAEHALINDKAGPA